MRNGINKFRMSKGIFLRKAIFLWVQSTFLNIFLYFDSTIKYCNWLLTPQNKTVLKISGKSNNVIKLVNILILVVCK